MVHRIAQVIVLGAIFFVAGCSSHPKFETHSYSLRQRATEEPLIKAILEDEAARLGTEALAEAVIARGGKMTALDITPDDVAIVRTTARGHAAIKKALKETHRATGEEGSL